jgi:endonuclease YncB( thermonuclease family)
MRCAQKPFVRVLLLTALLAGASNVLRAQQPGANGIAVAPVGVGAPDPAATGDPAADPAADPNAVDPNAPPPPKLNESGFTISPEANPLSPSDYRRVVGFAAAEAGDELNIAGQTGRRGTTVRLWGVDAPEMSQLCRTKRGVEYPCGEFARNVLKNFTQDKEVMCTVQFTTVRRVAVARCQIANVDLAAAMVAAGWAWAAPHVTTSYDRLQAKAQSRKLGMWAGRVEPPWNFRSRIGADANADPGPPLITYDYQR